MKVSVISSSDERESEPSKLAQSGFFRCMWFAAFTTDWVCLASGAEAVLDCIWVAGACAFYPAAPGSCQRQVCGSGSTPVPAVQQDVGLRESLDVLACTTPPVMETKSTEPLEKSLAFLALDPVALGLSHDIPEAA